MQCLHRLSDWVKALSKMVLHIRRMRRRMLEKSSLIVSGQGRVLRFTHDWDLWVCRGVLVCRGVVFHLVLETSLACISFLDRADVACPCKVLHHTRGSSHLCCLAVMIAIDLVIAILAVNPL
jgi:hypothetical protein